MDVIISYIIQLSPLIMLILFIVSLVLFFKSPTDSKKRKTWKILSIVFGVINAAILVVILAIIGIMMMAVSYM